MIVFCSDVSFFSNPGNLTEKMLISLCTYDNLTL